MTENLFDNDSECREDCEYDNERNNHCSIVVKVFLQVSCDEYPFRPKTSKKNLAVKGGRKVNNLVKTRPGVLLNPFLTTTAIFTTCQY